MNSLNNILNLSDINIINYILKLFFISIYAYYTSINLIKIENSSKWKYILKIIIFFIISIICGKIKYVLNSFNAIVCLVLLQTMVHFISFKKSFEYSLLITIISLSISYTLFIISVIISFIPIVLFNIINDYISFLIIIIIYSFLLILFLKNRRFKYGISFLKKNIQSEFWGMLILNISSILLFTIVILSNYKRDFTLNLMLSFIIFSIIMFITIQKSLQLYYKQKLLEQELNETKDELEKKKEEVKQLETENLNFSKTSHTLAHKQKSLEYKLEQLKQKYEIAEEIEIEDRIKDISKEIYNKTPEVELSKTGILEIDDMLKYMQSECIKNNIEFRLQIKGNIYEMINNYISKEDLSILIADHVKNAIIAINYSENINKSILVRLGKINKIYSLYIYDSGIEFEKETLSNLGKIPSTTHADNGGTGMGFMNTFDTLRKYNASLIINEYNKPSNDNYTKSIVIKLDKRNEFTINSYKDKINN